MHCNNNDTNTLKKKQELINLMKETNTNIPMKNLKENPNLISTRIYLTDIQVTTIRIIALRYAAWVTAINVEIAR